MPPKAAEPSTKKFFNLEVVRLNFQTEFLAPSEEEIKAVKQIAESNPEELDGREMWILKEFIEGDSDE